jgi:hypothetical protein
MSPACGNIVVVNNDEPLTSDVDRLNFAAGKTFLGKICQVTA